MSFRGDIRTRLTGDTTIANLVTKSVTVGGTTNSVVQVFGVCRSINSVSDYIVIRRLSSLPEHDLDGAGGEEVGRFELRCGSTDLATADAIAEAVRQRMQGRKNETWGSSTIYSVLFEDESDDLDPPIDGSESPFYVIVLVYRIQRVLAKPA